MANYVYEYKDGLYFNLTNRCSNKCSFCVRNHETDLKEKELLNIFDPSLNTKDLLTPDNSVLQYNIDNKQHPTKNLARFSYDSQG